MGKTTIATGNALAKKAWEEKLFRDQAKQSYFSQWEGNGEDSIVQVKTQLEKDKGDKITFGIAMRLTAPGVEDGATLEGNEEGLQTYDCSVTLKQYRHAVRTDGHLDEQRACFDIEDTSRNRLKDWGSEKIDQLRFDALGVGVNSTSSPTKVFYYDSSGVLTSASSFSTAQAAMSSIANQAINLDFIPQIKAWAKTGGGRSYVPLRPVKYKGKDYYVLLIHPDVSAGLKTNSDYKQAMREAADRGSENPLFTGAEAIYDGVVVHVHENCYASVTSGTYWARGVLMGAQSLVWAWGRRPKATQKNFDYDEETGYSWEIISGCARPEFNSKTYGSVGVVFARRNIAGL